MIDWPERTAQAACALGAIVAGAIVLSLGNPARAKPPAPSTERATGSTAARETPGASAGVAIRLIDRLGSATVEAPNLASTDSALEYWRRMRSPFVGPGGELGRAVQQIALVRSKGKNEKQSLGGAGAWIPDPKVWNMSEGSFDQRESIFAPPPATLRFTGLTLPAGASFETAPAVVGRAFGGVEFEVAVRPSGGDRVVVGKRAVDGKGRSFDDWRIDLSAYAGKPLELELTTRALETGEATPAAVWGSPIVTAKTGSDLPMNVLFIVVDALRSDALSSTHDAETDAKMAKADPPPLDAWLPALPEVAPNLDALAKRGATFTRAYSAGTWTRPGTIAMLTGIPSGDLGLSALPLVPAPADVRGFYAKKPPLLPLLLRQHGAVTRAVVNNFYMIGYAGVGLDMGFEGLVDHRYPLQDSDEIVRDTEALLTQHAGRRWFFFVNFASPHVPFSPPKSALEAIPEPPRGPREKLLRAYLAEIHKDDAAIGRVLEKLSALGLADDTLVIVTADHGETLSREHDAVPEGVDGGPAIGGRFHHLSSLWDETVLVPMIFVWPKKIKANTRVAGSVSTIDIVPTVLDLAGFDRPATISGQSLVPQLGGAAVPERTLLVEGRGARAIRSGRWRLVIRDPEYTHVRAHGGRIERAIELYDLEADPGERVECSKAHPDVVERLRALDRSRRDQAPSGAASPAESGSPVLHLRFATRSDRRRVTGKISVAGDAKLRAQPIGISEAALTSSDRSLDVDFETAADAIVGIDLTLEPPGADVMWELRIDGEPLAADQVYAGTYGLLARDLSGGIRGSAQRAMIEAANAPFIDPERDFGLFITRDRGGRELELNANDAAKAEAMGVMRAWGYVR